SGHHRRQLQARRRRTAALRDLEEERQVRDGAEEREADDEADRRTDREDPVAEQLERQDRLGRTALGEDEGGEQHHRERDQQERLVRAPGERRAAEAREEDDAREAAGEEHRAEVVDRVLDPLGARVEHRRDHEERERADGEVDVEDPAPREVVDEEPAEQRPDHGRDAEHRAEQALVAAALPRRDDVADDGDRRRQQAARAEALQRAERDQLRHVLRDPAERGADQEDDDRDLQRSLAAVEVAELAVERPCDRGREQVRRHDPRQMLDAAEVADDRRQRGRDDRLVERREQDDEDQRAEDDAHTLRRLLRSAHAEVVAASADTKRRTTRARPYTEGPWTRSRRQTPSGARSSRPSNTASCG